MSLDLGATCLPIESSVRAGGQLERCLVRNRAVCTPHDDLGPHWSGHFDERQRDVDRSVAPVRDCAGHCHIPPQAAAPQPGPALKTGEPDPLIHVPARLKIVATRRQRSGSPTYPDSAAARVTQRQCLPQHKTKSPGTRTHYSGNHGSWTTHYFRLRIRMFAEFVTHGQTPLDFGDASRRGATRQAGCGVRDLYDRGPYLLNVARRYSAARPVQTSPRLLLTQPSWADLAPRNCPARAVTRRFSVRNSSSELGWS